MSVSNRARIEAFIGASGSGKGVSIKLRLAELQPARLLIWDPRGEYQAHAQPYTTLPALVEALRRAGPAGGFRARYVPGGSLKLADAFALVCRLAFEAGSLVFLAEELSDVTTASYAPPAWRQCITQGRHKGLHLIGATQRPALIDKTFLANCTRVRCGVLGYEADRRTMATELDVSRDEVAALESLELPGGGARLQMIERDRSARSTRLVRITVNRSGRATESFDQAGLAPLRGGTGHVDGRGVSSRRVSSNTRKAFS